MDEKLHRVSLLQLGEVPTVTHRQLAAWVLAVVLLTLGSGCREDRCPESSRDLLEDTSVLGSCKGDEATFLPSVIRLTKRSAASSDGGGGAGGSGPEVGQAVGGTGGATPGSSSSPGSADVSLLLRSERGAPRAAAHVRIVTCPTDSASPDLIRLETTDSSCRREASGVLNCITSGHGTANFRVTRVGERGGNSQICALFLVGKEQGKAAGGEAGTSTGDDEAGKTVSARVVIESEEPASVPPTALRIEATNAALDDEAWRLRAVEFRCVREGESSPCAGSPPRRLRLRASLISEVDAGPATLVSASRDMQLSLTTTVDSGDGAWFSDSGECVLGGARASSMLATIPAGAPEVGTTLCVDPGGGKYDVEVAHVSVDDALEVTAGSAPIIVEPERLEVVFSRAGGTTLSNVRATLVNPCSLNLDVGGYRVRVGARDPATQAVVELSPAGELLGEINGSREYSPASIPAAGLQVFAQRESSPSETCSGLLLVPPTEAPTQPTGPATASSEPEIPAPDADAGTQ